MRGEDDEGLGVRSENDEGLGMRSEDDEGLGMRSEGLFFKILSCCSCN